MEERILREIDSKNERAGKIYTCPRRGLKNKKKERRKERKFDPDQSLFFSLNKLRDNRYNIHIINFVCFSLRDFIFLRCIKLKECMNMQQANVS